VGMLWSQIRVVGIILLQIGFVSILWSQIDDTGIVTTYLFCWYTMV